MPTVEAGELTCQNCGGTNTAMPAQAPGEDAKIVCDDCGNEIDLANIPFARQVLAQKIRTAL